MLNSDNEYNDDVITLLGNDNTYFNVECATSVDFLLTCLCHRDRVVIPAEVLCQYLSLQYTIKYKYMTGLSGI